MGFLERLFRGSDQPERQRRPTTLRPASRPAARTARTDDERAIERYRYLLKTAPPETMEQAHAEAFAQLTPEQRRTVLQELTQTLPESERAAATQAGDDPQALARTATRAEMRQPGTMERTFGGGRQGMMGGGIGGMGMGGMLGGSFLSSIAGVMVGSAIANQFFNDSGYNDESGGGDGEGGEGGDAGAEDTGAGDGGDVGGGDAGGDFGGGDFGGGDFGGGDFGGGDF
ncbi:MAG: hypothetical protein AVDCRST_MAG19-4584 [uncultured Thermomicrobiales bacterium]|uniref:Uncharacterized protein n=1 Tax=uncultured Thermomicrobiales bacterium TaxID=1645740 RepID=A0A6J4VX01_9BACT|nr:MAG: hypothetical protein AVDCRST_MAG19-4584 [uncultured Thermomicrobiales bacterium]